MLLEFHYNVQTFNCKEKNETKRKINNFINIIQYKVCKTMLFEMFLKNNWNLCDKFVNYRKKENNLIKSIKQLFQIHTNSLFIKQVL